MVRLTQILRWSDYFHMPKRYIERVKFNGTVIGNSLSEFKTKESNSIETIGNIETLFFNS